MDCVLTAGGVPRAEDLLYGYTRGRSKALLDVGGQPMVQWVLDALSGASTIDAIFLVGLEPEQGVHSPKIATYLPNQGSLLRNLLTGIERVLERRPDARQVAICMADIPLIRAEIVDDFVGRADDPAVSIYYGAVARTTMEAQFPDSRRSYVQLIEGDFAATDFHVVDPHIAHTHEALWNDLIAQRKQPWRQAGRLGLGLFVRLLLRRLSLQEAERRISRTLDLTLRAHLTPHPELGMDVDKPFQLEICRRALQATEP
ncbi:MAG: NTP transferase domain-containing protein [Anaerolineales bacterium]